jgi:hypothetical protein
MPCARAIDAARALLRDAHIDSPRDLDLELLAAHIGVMVLWGPLAREEGHILHADRWAVVRVAEHLRGTPRGRFVTAHEIGHRVLHRDADHFARCTGDDMPTGGARWRVEREANDFAVELLLPAAQVSPRCAHERVTLDDVSRIARDHGTSLTATAMRVTELAACACAVVLSRDGEVERWTKSATFRGVTARGRTLDPRALAASLERRASAELSPAVWGRARLGAPIVEEAIRLGARGPTLSWLWHAPRALRVSLDR